MIPDQDLIDDREWAAAGCDDDPDTLGPAVGFWHAGLVMLMTLVGWWICGVSMRWITVLVQASLVGVLSYAVIRTVQLELEARRWWLEHEQDMKGKARWKL